MDINSQNFVVLSTEQIAQTRQAIDTYIKNIESHPDCRTDAFPTYLLHEPGETIRGTVILFHSFSNTPHQMRRLANYLFHNCFNVYQPSLASHSFSPAANYWPQVKLRVEYSVPLQEKVKQNSSLQDFLSNIPLEEASKFQRLGNLSGVTLINQLSKIEPRLADIVQAIERHNDSDFERYFITSHMDYLIDANLRLVELDALPAPIYAVGLSIGGSVALALAAANPNRIKKVVAYAPLLEIYGENRERYLNLGATLGFCEIGWDPSQRFPIACHIATNRFGAFVRSSDVVQTLKNIPTFLVLTELDDVTHIETSQEFYNALGGKALGHCCYTYSNFDLVPHPMIDPTVVSQGMTNRFWQRLYQETFHFLTEGRINSDSMSSLTQSDDLPEVPPLNH